MNKEQWQQLYNNLRKIYNEYSDAYSDYDSGRNEAIRAKGGRKVETLIHHADHYITNNEEAFNLLTEGAGNNGYGRGIIYDEFRAPRYFERDMGDFLRKIEEKVRSFDS